jgi:hypothetical protein
MNEITLAYSPAIEALVGVFYLKMQLVLWLNESFRCHSFKEVKGNAKVYIFMDSEGKPVCSQYNYGEYLGCHFNGGKIYLNEGMLGQGKNIQYIRYLKGTWKHEWLHEFLPSEGEKLSIEEYNLNYC